MRLQSYVLLSETCLIDPLYGEPLLSPRPEHLGLDPSLFSIEPEYSFMRSTRWTPFNAYRSRQDLERVALVGGSVITVSAKQSDWDAIDLDAHLKRLAMGIGDHTTEGMGRIKTLHPLLQGDDSIKARRQRSSAQETSQKKSRSQPVFPQDELGRWMAKRRESEVYHDVALSIALELLKPMTERRTVAPLDLTPLIRSSRGLPSRSQWRNVETEARRYLMKSGGLKLLHTHLLEPSRREVRGSGGLLIRGTSKEEWRLEGDEEISVPTATQIRKTPGLAVAALLNSRTYEAFKTELSTLRAVTERRLESKRDRAEIDRFVINFLAPLVLTYVSRVIAARLQQSHSAGDR